MRNRTDSQTSYRKEQKSLHKKWATNQSVQVSTKMHMKLKYTAEVLKVFHIAKKENFWRRLAKCSKKSESL